MEWTRTHRVISYSGSKVTVASVMLENGVGLTRGGAVGARKVGEQWTVPHKADLVVVQETGNNVNCPERLALREQAAIAGVAKSREHNAEQQRQREARRHKGQ